MDTIPIQHEVRMASDMLGVNPIYLANEGNICIFVNTNYTQAVLKTLHCNKYGKNAKVIGKVSDSRDKNVIGITEDGNEVLIEYLYGMELPRLC